MAACARYHFSISFRVDFNCRNGNKPLVICFHKGVTARLPIARGIRQCHCSSLCALYNSMPTRALHDVRYLSHLKCAFTSVFLACGTARVFTLSVTPATWSGAIPARTMRRRCLGHSTIGLGSRAPWRRVLFQPFPHAQRRHGRKKTSGNGFADSLHCLYLARQPARLLRRGRVYATNSFSGRITGAIFDLRTLHCLD